MLVALWLCIGIAFGIIFVTLARKHQTGEPALLAAGLLVAALIYLVFGLTSGATADWLVTEAIGVGIYGIFALLGLRYSLWWLALGWAVHPAWDVGLHLLGEAKAFVPMGYVIVCISFDFIVAASILERVNKDYWLNLSKRPHQILLTLHR